MSTSITTTNTRPSYKKAEKRHYQKWMSNADIDNAITSTRASPETLAVTRRLEAEGKIEKDAASKFTEFSMRFQLPLSDYPLFSDAELLELAASLDSEPEPSVSPAEGSSANSTATGGEGTPNGDEGLDVMNQSSIDHVRINESLRAGVERSPANYAVSTSVTNDTQNNTVGMVPYAPLSPQYETPNIPPQFGNVVVKQEILTPPRNLTPPEVDFFLMPDEFPDEVIMIGGSSSSTAMMEPQRSTSNMVQQQWQMQPFRQPVGRPPQTGKVVRAPCYYPGQGQLATRTQVGQPTHNGQNYLPPVAAAGSAPTGLRSNFPFSSVGKRGYVQVNPPILANNVGDILQRGMQVPSSHFDGGMSVANGRTIGTPTSRSNQIPMISAPTSHAQTATNSVNPASLTPNSTARQLQIAGNSRAPSEMSVPARNHRTLQLSPYITPSQAKRRARSIGHAAAQKEIHNFAALIDAGNQAPSAFTRPLHTIPAGQQYGAHNIRPIAASQERQPSQLIERRAHMRGNQAQGPQLDCNNNASGSGTVALPRRAIIGQPTYSNGPVARLANTSSFDRIRP